MNKKWVPNKAEILLGKKIEKMRLRRGMSPLQLGREINQKEQQIKKYENGEFVPLPVLEEIASVLDVPIQKKLIRRISFLRKLEMETKIEQEDLVDLYNEVMSEE